MPQWDFLDFLADAGRALSRLPAAHAGARSTGPDRGGRPRRRRARDDARRPARDPRRSRRRRRRPPFDRARQGAGSTVDDLGAPMDVLWMRLSRRPSDPDADRSGRIDAGRILVMLDRGDYWQCAYVIPKGALDELLKRRASHAFRADIAAAACRSLADRVDELRDWDDVKLLTVAVDRLRAGIGRACCASAMPRTPCRRSAASASISRSRTPSRPPISCAGPLRERHADRRAISRACSSGASCRRASTQRMQVWCRTASSAACWRRAGAIAPPLAAAAASAFSGAAPDPGATHRRRRAARACRDAGGRVAFGREAPPHLVLIPAGGRRDFDGEPCSQRLRLAQPLLDGFGLASRCRPPPPCGRSTRWGRLSTRSAHRAARDASSTHQSPIAFWWAIRVAWGVETPTELTDTSYNGIIFLILGRGACDACPGASALKVTGTVARAVIYSPITGSRVCLRGRTAGAQPGGQHGTWAICCRHGDGSSRTFVWCIYDYRIAPLMISCCRDRSQGANTRRAVWRARRRGRAQ